MTDLRLMIGAPEQRSIVTVYKDGILICGYLPIVWDGTTIQYTVNAG